MQEKIKSITQSDQFQKKMAPPVEEIELTEVGSQYVVDSAGVVIFAVVGCLFFCDFADIRGVFAICIPSFNITIWSFEVITSLFCFTYFSFTRWINIGVKGVGVGLRMFSHSLPTKFTVVTNVHAQPLTKGAAQ